jgi:hypothetical protein
VAKDGTVSRPLRLEFPGAVYFISATGNARTPVFLKDQDWEQFLRLLGREVDQNGWLCHAYCLLEEEYRFVVETPEANLGRGMARLNAVYSQWFNRGYDRSGHVFQGRYKSILLEKETFLLPVCRDLALAPVQRGLVKRPGQWPWGSYRGLVKGRETPSWLHVSWLWAQFADDPEGPRKAYRAYVQGGKEDPGPWGDVRGQIFLGGEAFRKALSERIRSMPTDQIPRAMIRPDRPTAEEVLDAVARTAGVPSASVLDRHARQDVFRVTVYLLRRAANLPAREVARRAGVSPARISQIQRAVEEAGGLAALFPWANAGTLGLPSF